MTTTLLIIAIIPIALWLATRFVLDGERLDQYDTPQPELTGQRTEPSDAHHGVVAMFRAGTATAPRRSRKAMLTYLRGQMDAMGDDVVFEGEFRAVDAGGVAAEWVLAPGADTARRLLYIHGGAFTMGSPRSHRAITTEYARRLRVAVLAIDYRLMPEHSRNAGIADCQTAYRWLLENGPEGASPPTCLIVSGDSAGGNLTLMLTAWARNSGLRAADAAVALSPATDSTFSSPTLKANLETDVMLGPMFGNALARLPRWVMLWASLAGNRMRPSNPLVSPAMGDLSRLPPTLIHISSAEMLAGDGVRYRNKAVSQGSQVEIGTWPFMLHVWHAFVLHLPEAREAFDHIEAFLRRNVPTLASA